MTPDDLKGLSYADKLSAAATYAGVSTDLISGQYKQESNSGKHPTMVSKAGAKGHFQFMPSTIQTWSQRLGRPLDPFDFDDALTAYAHQMRENLKATGNVPDALRMYNAGTNRSHWDNDETNDYVKRILGVGSDPAKRSAAIEQPLATNPDLVTASAEDIIYGRNAGSDLNLVNHPKAKPSQKEIDAAAIGGVGIAPLDGESGTAWEEHKRDLDYKTDNFKPKTDTGDVIGAALDSTLTAAVFRSLDREVAGGQDPQFKSWVSQNIIKVREAANGDERTFTSLVRADTQAQYDVILDQAKRSRKNAEIMKEAGPIAATAASLGTGVFADPVGAIATLGVGTGFRAAGIGAEGLMASGRAASGLTSLLSEGFVGNVAATGALDLMGERQSVDDYFMAGATGILFSGMSIPGLMSHRRPITEAARANLDRALTELGPDAPTEAIVERAQTYAAEPGMRVLDQSLFGEASGFTFMPREAADALLTTPASKRNAQEAGMLDTLSDRTEAAVQAEVQANADAIVAANPVDQSRTGSWTSWLPETESSSSVLLKSKGSVFRAFAISTLESPAGAAGRRNNAAMTKYITERKLRTAMVGWNDLANNYIMDYAQGTGLITDQFTQKGKKEFNREVYLEVLARGQGRTRSSNELVISGANMLEKAFELSAHVQVEAKTAGHLRLPETSVGYLPRKLSVKEVKNLRDGSPQAFRQVIDYMALQLSHGEEAFDPAFAKKIAEDYMNRAVNRWTGEGEIPILLHEPDASATLRDALKAMTNGSEEEVEKLMGRFSRGGADWTKKRLDLDLLQPIKGADGQDMLLADLFKQDVYALWDRQVKRVSGEAALARHNILGEKGLKVIRDAGAKQVGVTIEEIKAFDHAAAEFLGMPLAGTGGSFNKHSPGIETLLSATSAVRLGQAVFPQMAELGNAIPALGVHRVFGAIVDLPRMVKEVRNLGKGEALTNPILKDFDKIAPVGADEYMGSGLFHSGIDDDFEMYGQQSMSIYGKIARIAGKAQYIVAGHRMVTAAQTRSLAEQLVKKVFVFAREGKNTQDLRDIGLSDNLIGRIKGNLDRLAKFDGNGNLLELNLYDGGLTGDDLLTLQVALHRGAGQMVQRTYIGETGTWVSNSMLKCLYQFRRTSIVAMEKQVKRDLANHHLVRAFAGMVAAYAFAIPIHLARLQARSLGMDEQERREYLEKNTSTAALGLAALNYATKTGVMADVTQIGLGITAGWNDDIGNLYSAVSGGARAGTRPLLGGTAAPALGLVEQGWQGITGKPERLLGLIPGANIIYLQPFLNALEPDDD